MRFIVPLAATALAAGGVYASDAFERPVRLEAGLWQIETELLKFSAAGVSSGDEAAVQKALVGDYLGSQPLRCVSEEEAREALTPATFARINGSSEDCSLAKWDLSGGKLDVQGSCRSESGGPARRFSASGTIDAGAMDFVIAFDVNDPSTGAEIQSRLRVTGRRTGPCDAPPPADPFNSTPTRADVEAAAAAMQDGSAAEDVEAGDAPEEFDEAANAAASMIPDIQSQ